MNLAIKSLCAALVLLVCGGVAHAQSQSVRFARGAVLTADQLRALQAAKLDAVNGTATGLTVTQRLQTPAGSFNTPQSGSNLGIGAQTYLAPNQVVPGSVTVQGNAPIIHLLSFLHPYPLDIWMSPDGAGNMSVNDPVGGTFNLFTHTFNIGGTDQGAIINLYGGGTGGAMQIFQTAAGEGWLITPGYTLNISAGAGVVRILSAIRNSAMPTAPPSSGAHFVCVDDAGDLYRSDSACK
ncbi:MAG: hypothetical protein ACTIDN_00020 [Acetobacter sp.]|uniref:hypothetical protein n=1 Tax=Acetobacter sp. TaxID=440 RepID=UPI003F8F0EF6